MGVPGATQGVLVGHLFSQSRQTANKVHWCDRCGEAINPGIEYYRAVVTTEDGTCVEKLHLECTADCLEKKAAS